jgi:hypothetical protein
MEQDEQRIGRFDQVRIITTKRVNYLSAPEGELLNPKGIWMVAGAVGDELLLTKGNIVIKIPPTDVMKVLDYHKTFGNIMSSLGRFNSYETGQERKPQINTGSDEED